MIIKATYPFKIDDRVVMPGETIDAPRGKALEYIGNGWAIEVAEASIKTRKVKNGSRKNAK